jgi:D-inositol-3-phosphate glycosyltransferase
MSGLVAEGLKNQWPDVPVLQMFHTLGHMKNRVSDSESNRAPQARIDGESHILSFVDRVIAATPAEYAQLHWLYGANMEKVAVIPPGVDLDRFSPIPRKIAKANLGMPEDHKNILFAGRIEPLKGIDTLLLAIALIQKQNPELADHVSVNIIGGDPWSDTVDDEMIRLQELRQSLDVADIVTFLGSKAQDDLPDYYAAAEMVVMPSHYESLGFLHC